jgi:hypothetical protein
MPFMKRPLPRTYMLTMVLAVFLVSQLALTGRAGDVGDSSSDPLARGTTLERSIVTQAPRSLRYGPGTPRVTRRLGWEHSSGPGRPLAGFKQLSDVQVVDEESPLRAEFGCAARLQFRVQEAMSTHIVASMLRRLAQIKLGPATGVPLTKLISTGDNADNNQLNETR